MLDPAVLHSSGEYHEPWLVLFPAVYLTLIPAVGRSRVPSFSFKLLIPPPSSSPHLRLGKSWTTHWSITTACGACRNVVIDLLVGYVPKGVSLDSCPPCTSCKQGDEGVVELSTRLSVKSCPTCLAGLGFAANADMLGTLLSASLASLRAGA